MKIQKNIPMPPKAIPSVSKPLGPVSQILRSADFEVGDSFLAPPACVKSLQSMFWASRQATGRKFARRKTAEGVRVWRVA